MTVTKWEDVREGDELTLGQLTFRRSSFGHWVTEYSSLAVHEDQLDRWIRCGVVSISRPDPKTLEPWNGRVKGGQIVRPCVYLDEHWSGREVVVIDLSGGEWEHRKELIHPNPTVGGTFEGYVRRLP